MTQFQNGWNKAAGALKSKHNPRKQDSEQSRESENATMKVAGVLAHLAGRQLSFKERKKAGLVVHYAFGTLMGGIYGLAAEKSPLQLRRHTALSGMGLGTTLFVTADEIAVTQLGLSRGPAPLSSHLYGLASHLIYGITTAVTHARVRQEL